MTDAEYFAMMEELATSAPTTAIVDDSLLFFVRYGYVPYTNAGVVASALGVDNDELRRLLPRSTAYGAHFLEYDDLWDDLVDLARAGFPGAARTFLALYRDHGMPNA